MAKKKREIKKHSAIIQISNLITGQQRKIFNTLMYFAKKDLQEDENKLLFKIPVIEIKKLLAENHRKSVNDRETKDNLKSLRDISIEFNLLEKDNSKSWITMGLLAQAKIHNGFAVYQFPEMIREEIKRPNIYCLLDLEVVNKLKSKYSLALYELARDYINKEVPKMEVEKFRKIMGLENKYPNFGDVKEKILIKAVNEIKEKTDLEIDFELISSGRRITHIKFYAKRKKVKDIEKPELEISINEISEKEFITEILSLIPSYEILTDKEIQDLKGFIQQFGKEIITSNIKYTNRQNYQNYFVYLRKSILEDYAEKDRKVAEMKVEERKKHETQVKKEEEEAKQREALRNQAKNYYQILSPEEKQEIETQVNKELENLEGINVIKKNQFIYDNMKLNKIIEIVQERYF